MGAISFVRTEEGEKYIFLSRVSFTLGLLYFRRNKSSPLKMEGAKNEVTALSGINSGLTNISSPLHI